MNENKSLPTVPSKKLWRAGTLTYTTAGLVLLGIWLIGGDFPWALKDRAVTPSATLLIKQIGVSEFIFGLIIISFPNFTNIFLAPVISYISDRHRGRFGRRIPFLIFSTPFIVIGLYLLGFTPLLGAGLNKLIPAISEQIGMLIIFCIAWVLLDFGTTLSGSLFNALANDVVPTEVMGRFFSLFRMVSLGAGIVFNKWLIDKVATHTMAIFLGIGTLYGLGLLLLCIKVKEGKYAPPPEEPVPADGVEGTVFIRVMHSAANYFRQSFSLPYYRWYMLAVTLAALSFAPINYFAIQYTQKLGLSTATYGYYLVITYVVSFGLSFFLGAFADRFHPLRCGITVLAVYMVLMLVSWKLMGKPEYFGTIFVLHGIISGCYMTLTASLPARLLPRPLFAQFGSACGLVTAVFSLVLAPVLGWTLDCLEHNYRYLFIFGGFITLSSLLLMFKVYRNFKKHGGIAAYVPPMPR